MSRTVKIIKNAEVQFGPVVDPPATFVGVDFSCQITEARITASANTTDIDATFCEPASSINVPSSFSLELNGLQDWGDAESFSEYAFINDAEQVMFALFLDGTSDPAATGVCSMAAGDFGGVAGEPLTFSASLPILGYPDITDSAGVSLRGGAPLGVAAADATEPVDENAPA
jgi:hypothetical protein